MDVVLLDDGVVGDEATSELGIVLRAFFSQSGRLTLVEVVVHDNVATTRGGGIESYEYTVRRTRSPGSARMRRSCASR